MSLPVAAPGGAGQPAHPGSQAGQGDRVGADAALQVHAAQPGHVAEAGTVEPDHATAELRVSREAINRIVAGRRVRGARSSQLARLTVT